MSAEPALLDTNVQPVAQATKSGTFRFETTLLPQNCTGSLSDGNQTVAVVIQYCGPVGPRGPQGNPGSHRAMLPGPSNSHSDADTGQIGIFSGVFAPAS